MRFVKAIACTACGYNYPHTFHKSVLEVETLCGILKFGIILYLCTNFTNVSFRLTFIHGSPARLPFLWDNNSGFVYFFYFHLVLFLVRGYKQIMGFSFLFLALRYLSSVPAWHWMPLVHCRQQYNRIYPDVLRTFSSVRLWNKCYIYYNWSKYRG